MKQPFSMNIVLVPLLAVLALAALVRGEEITTQQSHRRASIEPLQVNRRVEPVGESLVNEADGVARSPLPAVIVVVQTNEVRLNEPFAVELRVENRSETNQTIRVMNCSWYDHWQCSNPAVSPLLWGCGKNFAADVILKPNRAYTNVLKMQVVEATTNQRVSFRMGFNPIGVTNTWWSDDVSIKVTR